ncbi:MAG TPA: hypothetical protein VF494_00955 [Candidatus Limnocylindrales bacterium]
MTSREAAWNLVWEALPAHWMVGEPSLTPGPGVWSVSAIDARTTGRGRIPRSVTGTGDTDAAALLDLNDRLRGVSKPDGTRLDELRRACRLAYLSGAEDFSRSFFSRPLTNLELAGVVARFPDAPAD